MCITNLLLGLVANKRVAALDELQSKLIQLLEVVRGVRDSHRLISEPFQLEHATNLSGTASVKALYALSYRHQATRTYKYKVRVYSHTQLSVSLISSRQGFIFAVYRTQDGADTVETHHVETQNVLGARHRHNADLDS